MPTFTVIKNNIAQCKAVTPTCVFNSVLDNNGSSSELNAFLNEHHCFIFAVLLSVLLGILDKFPHHERALLFSSNQLITVTIRWVHNPFYLKEANVC